MKKDSPTHLILRGDESLEDSLTGTNKSFLSRIQKSDMIIPIGMILIIGAMLGVVFVVYRFMKNDHIRWKMLSTELMKQRAHIDQVMNQLKKLEEERRTIDNDWADQVKRMVVSKAKYPPVDIELDPDVMRVSPVIMTEDAMDEALVEELQELQQSNKTGDDIEVV